MKNIIIQGLGFVGSAMAVVVASRVDSQGNPLFNTVGIDLSTKEGQERINAINSGQFPFNTSDQKISNELKEAVKRGNLIATSSKDTYLGADVVIVSINCDLVKINGQEKIDLENFSKSVQEIAENISENTLVIIESTVPPGTCDKIVHPVFEKYFKKRNLNIDNFFLAHSYERVMPGEHYFDSIVNYWRVYSGINEESATKCEEFLTQLINIADYPLTRLKNTTASETGKLLENSYRAVNIAFIEEWGRFAEEVGVDLFEVLYAIRQRPTHSNIRQPGFGVGGYCLTKDPLFARIAARDIFNLDGHDFPFSSKAVQVNSEMPLVTLNKIKQYFGGDIEGKKILLMGITYRQDVGDTRFSPSEIFYNAVIGQGANITAHDPLMNYWEETNLKVLNELPDLDGIDVVIFAVPHKSFTEINFEDWVSKRNILVFDANNVLTKEQVAVINKNKHNYLSIGRG